MEDEDASRGNSLFQHALGIWRDSFTYFMSKVVPGAMGLLSVMVFVRLIGYEEYGRYSVLFATAMAVSSGMSGWLSQGVLRFQSRYHEGSELRNFKQAIHAGTALSAVVGAIVLAGFLRLWASGTSSTVAVLVSVGFFSVVLAYTVALARLQASLRSFRVLRLECIRSIAAVVFPLLLVWWLGKKDHRVLLLGILLGYLVALGASLMPWEASFWRLQLSQQRRALLGEVWRYGWPVGLWLFCQQSLVISDRFFIQRFCGYSAAGVYASMYDVIVRSFSLTFTPITMAVHPLVMHHWNIGARAQSVRVIRSAIRWQVYLFIPIAIVFFFTSSLLARVVLGRPNPEAASVVVPLAIGGFFWQMALLAHKPLEILCQTKRILGGMLVAFMVNLCGDYLLIPRFGFRAAAYVLVASSLSYLLMLRMVTPAGFFTQAALIQTTVALEGVVSLGSESTVLTPRIAEGQD